jgi:serine/threonine protein kinase
MKPLSPNTMIQNRYLVVHLIGKGGMGEVYLAVDQRLGSAVALKRTSFADDPTLAAAFEREAKILARLRHPVLPKVSDHFTENSEQYLVMEHISGDDLSKRLESAGRPFPVSWVMFWADQLLDALSYLHSHEPPIIHRDIKPQNLKLTDENHIVLLDFGLSKDTSNLSPASAPGTSGSVVGYTPHFAPMEQIRGTGTNPRSDIYSLSATLYQLMTNVVPADALSRADTMLNGQADPILALSDANPEVSPAVSNVILKGLAVSQDKRFATASEMQKALRSAYAQMNDQMAAETMVINVGDHAGADLHQTTPPIDVGRSVAPSEMATMTPSLPARNTQPEPETVIAAEVVGEEPSMEATIQMDVPPVVTPTRQADVKTEVFLAADLKREFPAAESYRTEDHAAPNTEEFSPEVVSSVPDEVPASVFEPASTVPLFTANGDDAAKADEPSTPDFFETAAAVSVPTPTPPTPAFAQVQQQTPPPAQAKKKSKAGLILGGLAALFILGFIAMGAGYFVYTNYYAGKVVKPSPSPSATVESTPSPSPTPTVEPTPESTVNALSDTNSNTNSSSSDVNASPTTTPAGGPFPRQTPQVAPTKSTTVVKPTATPSAKPTPKAKPSTDRTVILQ